MMKIMIKQLLIFSIILCTSCNYTTISPFAEIADPHLPEIAMIRADPHWGALVIYNPDTCREIGKACGFLRLHAFAHRHLNHTLLSEPAAYPESQEAQVDCWSAKYGKANEVQAIVQLLLDDNKNPNWKIHGDPFKRVKIITTCAKEAGKWLEN